MISALFNHISLLLTMRHYGQGLNAKSGVTIAIFVLAIFIQYLRWNVIGSSESVGPLIFTVLIFLFFYAKLDRPIVNGYFLISIGVDIVAICLGGMTVPPMSLLFSVWEFAAIVFFIISYNQVKNGTKK